MGPVFKGLFCNLAVFVSSVHIARVKQNRFSKLSDLHNIYCRHVSRPSSTLLHVKIVIG
jgi:hypothetical protein